MSKPRLVKNWEEVQEVVDKFKSGKLNEHIFVSMLVQIVEREKIRVLNNYLKARGEEMIPTDPPKLPGSGEYWEWIIPVPGNWTNMVHHQFKPTYKEPK